MIYPMRLTVKRASVDDPDAGALARWRTQRRSDQDSRSWRTLGRNRERSDSGWACCSFFKT